MSQYIVRRLLASIPTLLAVLTLVFVVVRVVPGDPAIAILGDQATPAAVDALRESLGLNKPIYAQYFEFLARSLSGDLGQSMVNGHAVLREIASVLPHTLVLTFAAACVGVAIGLPLGTWAALHHNAIIDVTARIISLIGLSFPVFVSGVFLLLVFGLHWPLFPILGTPRPGDSALDAMQKLVLPAATLGIPMAAYITRVSRSSMLQVLGDDYIRTARSKGVPRRLIIWRHALRNAAIPVLTVGGLYVGNLIGTSVLTEIVFTRPGLGSVIVAALTQRDYTMLQGLMVIYTFLIILVNLVTDLLYGVIDPRVRVS